jgi:hypothetical protein
MADYVFFPPKKHKMPHCLVEKNTGRMIGLINFRKLEEKISMDKFSSLQKEIILHVLFSNMFQNLISHFVRA